MYKELKQVKNYLEKAERIFSDSKKTGRVTLVSNRTL